MLNDISGMADWGKVCQGLMRMFEGTFAVLTAPQLDSTRVFVMEKITVIQVSEFGIIKNSTQLKANYKYAYFQVKFFQNFQ